MVLLSDGGLLATQMMTEPAEGAGGEPDPNGFAVRWSAAEGFRAVPGSDTFLPNGLEVSADETTLFLNSTLDGGLIRIDLRTGRTTGRVEGLRGLDNSSWAPDGRLLVAHLLAEETEEFMACQRPRAPGPCPIPFQILAVDPSSLEVETRFDSAGSPMGGGTVGLQVGEELFIGSFSADRILRIELSRGEP